MNIKSNYYGSIWLWNYLFWLKCHILMLQSPVCPPPYHQVEYIKFLLLPNHAQICHESLSCCNFNPDQANEIIMTPEFITLNFMQCAPRDSYARAAWKFARTPNIWDTQDWDTQASNIFLWTNHFHRGEKGRTNNDLSMKSFPP